MGRTIVPKIITEDIKHFSQIINQASNLEYINVISDDKYLPHECFNNVRNKINESGGRAQLGWAIWLFPNILIEAECHCIWISDNDEKIDVTPNDENTILFLPDDSIKYEGKVIPNKRAALTSSSLVSEFIGLANQRDNILSNYPESQTICSLPTKLVLRLQEILNIFNTKVERNDRCPCQSGLKYKRCWGK